MPRPGLAPAQPGAGSGRRSSCHCDPKTGRISRIVEVGIEIAHAVVGFVGVRNAVPAQAEVQGQAVVNAPVVLDVGGPGNVVPVAVILNRELVDKSEAVPSRSRRSLFPVKLPLKVKPILACLAEQVLNLLVQRPAAAHLELMRALGPGDVVADLVVIRLVVPGPTGDFEVRPAVAAQVDVRGYGCTLFGPVKSLELSNRNRWRPSWPTPVAA